MESVTPNDMSEASAGSSWLRRAKLIERFEERWQQPGEADIADFVSEYPAGPGRVALLHELVKVDMEYRWRRGDPVRVESYAARFPELGDSSTLPIELITEEVRVRRLCNCPPSVEELTERFPGRAAELERLTGEAPTTEQRGGANDCLIAEAPGAAGSLATPGLVDPTLDLTHAPMVPSAEEVPRRLGRYEILQRIGRGGFSTVYRALDTELRREVAVKVPRAELMEMPGLGGRVQREAQTAARLRHPAIVPIHEVGEDGGTTYIVYEFIRGPTLTRLLRETVPSPQQTAEWVARLAEALDYAHQNGIVHRDFGFGWSLSVAEPDIRETLPPGLEQQFGFAFATPFRSDTRVYLTDPDGRRVGFTFDSVPDVSFIGTFFTPKFTADPGVYDRLEVDPTSLSQAADGSFAVFLLGFPYNPSAYRLVRPDGTVYHYDQFTGLQGVTDRNGNGLTYTDAGIFHTSGQSIQFVRDALGRINEIIDPAGNSIRYTYAAAGDLVAVTDQVGLTTQFTYFADPAHYLNEAIDPLGRMAQRTEYDDQGRVVAVIDALGNRQAQFFDPANFTGSRIDAKGSITTYLYNERGNILEIRNPLGGLRTFAYDDPLNPDRETAITDENGHTTRFTYDGRSNLLTQTDALGGVTSWTYDEFANVTSFTDPLGRATHATYDSRGNLTELTSPAGDRVQFAYDTEGRVVERIDVRGGTTTLVYGTGPRPTRVTNPDGTSREYTYTDFGALLTATDETGSATTFVYEESGRLMGRRDHMGHEVTFAYAGNNIVSATDELGHTTVFEYDDADNVIRQVDSLGGVTASSYDANGNLASLTDSLGNTTVFAYDALNRLIATTDPLGQMTTVRYDAFGNQTEVVDRNGRRRLFDYDAINRPVRESWFEAGTVVRTIDSTYDAAGNLLARSDFDSSYRITYDVLDRVLSMDNAGTPGVPAVVLSYAYDGDGNQLRVQDSSGVRVDSAYDPNGQLTVRTWQGSGIDPARVEFSYNASGSRTSLSRFRDLAGTQLVGRTAIARDSLQQITGIEHRDALDAVLADYDYTRDALGQVMQETRNGQTVDYIYDVLGQLVETQRASLVDEVFAYDANGNRTGAGIVVDPNNRLLSDGVFNYEYDAEGNLIRKVETATGTATGTVTTYTYDHRNRLVRVEERSAGGIILNETAFTYDVFGRRIAKTSNGQTTYTVYDGFDAWADFDATGAVLARYLFGTRIDQILARFRPGEGTAWYLTDRLGTVRDVADAQGRIIGHIEYDSFGTVIAETGSIDRFRFTGREFDEQTGLYYYRTRYYDPGVGRFISEDPLGLTVGDANLYRYVGNRPNTATDPLGLHDASEESLLSSIQRGAQEALCAAVGSATENIVLVVLVGQGVPPALASAAGTGAGTVVEFVCGVAIGPNTPKAKPRPPDPAPPSAPSKPAPPKPMPDPDPFEDEIPTALKIAPLPTTRKPNVDADYYSKVQETLLNERKPPTTYYPDE